MPFGLLKERNPDKEAEEAEKVELIRSMQAEGMPYAQIAEMLGYKSKSTILHILSQPVSYAFNLPMILND